MRQHNGWCVCVRPVWRGMLDCNPAYLSTQDAHAHTHTHTHTHQMLCCRITTLNFTFLTNFKISNFNKEHTSSLKMI